jgi:hypothetical protein
LISATSTDFPTSSEQVSPWAPKTHFHDFVLALVGAFLPQTQWAIFEKIPVLPPARDEKIHPSNDLIKGRCSDFSLPKVCDFAEPRHLFPSPWNRTTFKRSCAESPCRNGLIPRMSEMIATANAKSIEEIKSFLSRQKETYKIPYETHPADRKRQCVFGGSSNRLDFLPLDRSGNRRFLPVMVNPTQAEVHILEDEQGSRDYIDQLWAEAMVIYRSGDFQLTLSSDMSDYLKTHQADFMPEDTITGQILGWLEQYDGDKVCSRQLYAEALGHGALEPKQWELRDICDVMNNAASGWQAFPNPRRFPSPYGRQKGWERVISPDNEAAVFRELTEAEAEQLGLPEEWLTG